MKKLITLILAGVLIGALGAGCEDNTPPSAVMIVDYVIVNLLDSDITIEQNDNNEQTITINPGGIMKTSSNISAGFFYKGKHPYMSMPENIHISSNLIMKVDGEIISESIWSTEYWDFDSDGVNVRTREVAVPVYYNPTFTLLVTNELLDEIKNL